MQNDALGTVDKALDVLFHLHGSGAGGVTSIGRALGLPKSTTHRMLSALGRRGLVERDAQGRYRPGMALVALGLGALDGEPAVAAARPVLESEAEATGESLFLAVARAGRILVVDKVEGTGFLRAAPSVGATVPVHATAAGKLYLAFAPDLVEVGRAPTRFTAQTRTARSALAREVSRVRRRGWAENREEWQPGLTVLAAPVFGGERLAGAIALAAPSARVTASDRARFARRLGRAAKRVGARLAGSGS